MRNKQEIHGKSAFVEIVGSVALLICMFLPWMTLSIGGSGTLGFSTHQSYSFFGAIEQLSRLGRGVSDVSSLFSSDGVGVANYANLLYLIPILCVVNPIVQYFIRLPWLSFYTALIPTALSFVAAFGYGYVANELGAYSSLGGLELGAGSMLTMFVGPLMIVASWTSIGWYYKEHWIYLVLVTVWVILSFVFPFHTRSGEQLFLLIVFFGRIYIPFIIYAVLLLLISFATEPGEIGKSDRPVEEHTSVNPNVETDGYLDSVRMRSDENLKEILRNKEDYSERLVKAAEQVLLERVTAVLPAASVETLVPSELPASSPDDDKYKAYQPKPSSETDKQTDSPQPAQKEELVRTESSVKESVATTTVSDIAPAVATPEVVTATPVKEQQVSSSASDAVSASAPVRKSNTALIVSIVVAVVLLTGGALTYFLWYVPYAKDRDALRTYVVANNLFLRSSQVSGVEYNVLSKVPYGSEIITYNMSYEWAEVKVNGQTGFMSSPYLLQSEDFFLLNGVWGDADSKECIESTKCRLAILDFYKNNRYSSGANGWQIYTRLKGQKPNAVFYPRLYDKNSKFTDFVFILKNNQGGNRIMVGYSFEDETEKPIFRFSVGVPEDGYIENMRLVRGEALVTLDTGYSFKFSL